MRRPRPILAASLALAAAAVPAGGLAHPHVFIDSGVDFVFDDGGRLSHLRITWLYDHLSSLLLLEDLGIAEGAGGALGEEDRAAIARDQSSWVEGYEGDATLVQGGRRVGLSGPIEPVADYRDGQIEIRFLRALQEPVVPGAAPEEAAVAKLYDPSYFVAYFVAFAPRLEHAPAACAAEVVPFEPTAPLVALQQSLFEVPPDEDPEEPVGHLFADRVFLTCE